MNTERSKLTIDKDYAIEPVANEDNIYLLSVKGSDGNMRSTNLYFKLKDAEPKQYSISIYKEDKEEPFDYNGLVIEPRRQDTSIEIDVGSNINVHFLARGKNQNREVAISERPALVIGDILDFYLSKNINITFSQGEDIDITRFIVNNSKNVEIKNFTKTKSVSKIEISQSDNFIIKAKSKIDSLLLLQSNRRSNHTGELTIKKGDDKNNHIEEFSLYHSNFESLNGGKSARLSFGINEKFSCENAIFKATGDEKTFCSSVDRFSISGGVITVGGNFFLKAKDATIIRDKYYDALLINVGDSYFTGKLFKLRHQNLVLNNTTFLTNSGSAMFDAEETPPTCTYLNDFYYENNIPDDEIRFSNFHATDSTVKFNGQDGAKGALWSGVCNNADIVNCIARTQENHRGSIEFCIKNEADGGVKSTMSLNNLSFEENANFDLINMKNTNVAIFNTIFNGRNNEIWVNKASLHIRDCEFSSTSLKVINKNENTKADLAIENSLFESNSRIELTGEAKIESSILNQASLTNFNLAKDSSFCSFDGKQSQYINFNSAKNNGAKSELDQSVGVVNNNLERL